MGAAQFREGDTLFLCRVAGIAIDADRVLLQTSEFDDFWAVPGGRIDVGETATEALLREMAEELGAEVRVGSLLWVVENFFTNAALDGPPTGSEMIAHHELGLYFEMRLPSYLTAKPAFPGIELAGSPDEFHLEFRWFEVSNLADLDVRPAPIRELLAQPLPGGVPTVVNREVRGG